MMSNYLNKNQLTKHQKEIDELSLENYKLRKEKKRLEDTINKGGIRGKFLNHEDDKIKLNRKLDEDRIIEEVKSMKEWFENYSESNSK